MIVISKPLFYSKITPEVTCREALHEWTSSCLLGNLARCKYFATGVFYFYLPIHMVKLLTDYKKIDKKYLKKFTTNYLRSECFGLAYGFLTLYTMCLCNTILGRLYYEGVGFLPGFVAGLSLLFETPENRLLNSLLWASLVVEALFKRAYYFKIIRYTPLRETALFMVINSLLMYLLSKTDKKKIPIRIWFYSPPSKNHGCKSFNIKDLIEISKYFGIGYGLSCARPVINSVINLHKISANTFLRSLINQKHFKFGVLLGGYIALFKFSWYFLQKYNVSYEKSAAIAGLAAGMSYYSKPMTSILAMAIVTSLQILCEQFSKKLPKFPYKELIYMTCNGIVFQTRLVAPMTCPAYYSNMLKFASNGLIDMVYDSLVQKYIIDNTYIKHTTLVVP